MDSNEIDYYSVLNIHRDANLEEIVLAYRKQAIRCHPQRGPNSDMIPYNPPDGIPDEDHLPGLPLSAQWQLVNKAYDILGNPLNREVYDRYGEQGLQKGVPLPRGYFHPYTYHGDCNQTYKEVFGSFSPYAAIIDAITNPPPLYNINGRKGLKEKDPPVEKLLYLDLNDVFQGTSKRMKILRHEFVNESRTKTEIREKILIVPIAPGTLPGTQITFKEEGDQTPTRKPADIIFITADKPHDVFSRKGADLWMDYEISLIEALTGFYLNFTTLDNRKISLAITDLIQPNYVKKIPGEGLPKPHQKERGDLYIQFKVRFPKHVPREKKNEIVSLFRTIYEYSEKQEKMHAQNKPNNKTSVRKKD